MSQHERLRESVARQQARRSYMSIGADKRAIDAAIKHDEELLAEYDALLAQRDELAQTITQFLLADRRYHVTGLATSDWDDHVVSENRLRRARIDLAHALAKLGTP